MSGLGRDFRKPRFWQRFTVHAFSAVGACAILLEIRGWIFGNQFAPTGWALSVPLILIAGLYGLYRSWPRPIRHQLSTPNTLIKIVPGDLLASSTDLVIGMTDTFDTSTPHVIAEGSVQAQMAARLFGNDIAELDIQIAQALEGQTIVDTIAKQGKTDKYGLGSVATLTSAGRKLYLLAYTEMNEENNALSSPDGLWKSLHSLWRTIAASGNGRAVSIPVIGQGQSRLSQFIPAQDAIRFTLLSFIFASRQSRVCEELTIVVRQTEYDKLDHLELQAFLKSLQPS